MAGFLRTQRRRRPCRPFRLAPGSIAPLSRIFHNLRAQREAGRGRKIDPAAASLSAAICGSETRLNPVRLETLSPAGGGSP